MSFKPLAEILANLAAKAPAFVGESSFDCSLCKDRGWIVEADGRGGTAKPCQCVTNRPIEEKMRRAGVDASLVGATWDHVYPPKPDLSTFPEPDSLLALMGPVGTGKSYVAAAILRRWLEQGKRCRFLPCDQFIGDCRACYEDGGHPELIIAELLRYDLVVIDEAYGDRKTEFADDVTSMLIRRALRNRVPLIVTTNQQESDLLEIEPKVASRTTGTGAIAYDYTGRPDYRKNVNAPWTQYPPKRER